MTNLLAYIPFVDPIHALQDWWYLLLLPLAFGIAVIYKALRSPQFERYWQNVLVMTGQIVAAMIALAVVLVVAIQVLIPLIPVD